MFSSLLGEKTRFLCAETCYAVFKIDMTAIANSDPVAAPALRTGTSHCLSAGIQGERCRPEHHKRHLFLYRILNDRAGDDQSRLRESSSGKYDANGMFVGPLRQQPFGIISRLDRRKWNQAHWPIRPDYPGLFNLLHGGLKTDREKV